MLNIARSDSLADKLTSISDLNDFWCLMIRFANLLQAPTVSIYQLFKTITFVFVSLIWWKKNKLQITNFQLPAPKYPNQAFLVLNLGIFVLHQLRNLRALISNMTMAFSNFNLKIPK